MREDSYFYYWICDFPQKMNYKKMASTWRNFKYIFSRPLYTIIFRPKILILDTDSILKVNELVKWYVLRILFWKKKKRNLPLQKKSLPIFSPLKNRPPKKPTKEQKT